MIRILDVMGGMEDFGAVQQIRPGSTAVFCQTIYSTLHPPLD
jgi:hypothetical protein